MTRRRPACRLLLALLATTWLAAGCDQLGIETPAAQGAKREAEGKAIGGACRHAGRAIEDCYALNKKGDKAAIFAGWREMNDYMRENKLEPVPPQLTAQVPAKEEAEEVAEEPVAKPKSKDKPKHGA